MAFGEEGMVRGKADLSASTAAKCLVLGYIKGSGALKEVSH